MSWTIADVTSNARAGCELDRFIGGIFREPRYGVVIAPPLDLPPNSSQEDKPSELWNILIDF